MQHIGGLELLPPSQVARQAVEQYRPVLHYRTFQVNCPADRTLLTAMFFVQESLLSLAGSHPFGGVKIPGEPGFPGGHEASVDSLEEANVLRDYLQQVRRHVDQELAAALDGCTEQGRDLWLSLQKKKFLNRALMH